MHHGSSVVTKCKFAPRPWQQPTEENRIIKDMIRYHLESVQHTVIYGRVNIDCDSSVSPSGINNGNEIGEAERHKL